MNTTTNCPGCTALQRMHKDLKCNAHRTESLSATIIGKARATGATVADGDWRTAETVLNARPVVIG